jgi:Leucine-rich repeat (LRR) protein
MLHNALDSRRKREKLLALVLEHQRASPETIQQLWLPYLEGQRIALDEPFGTTTSLEDAEVLAALLPGAKFRLSLGHMEEGAFDAKQLAGDARLQHISGLIFDGIPLQEDDLEVILESPHLHTLVELDLGNTRIGSLEPLFRSDKSRSLRILDLQRNVGPNFDLTRFAENFPNLRTLDLSNCYFPKEWAREQLSKLTNLEHLYLD